MTAFQDTWARPLAKELVDLFRVPSLSYYRITTTYDPAVGEVVRTEEETAAAGAVTRTGRTEEGGVGETYTLDAWFDAGSLGDIWPTTGDEIGYDGSRWKVTNVVPQFSGDVKYACKVSARRI